ncbi:cytochrome c oxidase assembly protein [Lederbergia sp. NSJ-179]|uniref:cytochrome c oxidase assembly protein n=1 Tax=Lederbergia sp. NSJ-179 TaxID=2931402 RepID=UPI001FD2D1BD|nr:cytochrome c oxidase assembly protein [Lederbergia sp. NSJ-179]MCJ7842367.1 cytochrome c oxidase assembly protein [Lederbergia sp. NSJ-179]
MLTKLYSLYPWYELWNPLLLLFLLFLSWLYYKKIVTSVEKMVTNRHLYCFLSSIVLLYFVKGSPLRIMGNDFLFTAYVFGVAILYFAIIPLFILSLPASFLQKYFWGYRLRKVVQIFSYPWIAAIIFNGVLTLYFVPYFFNQIHESDLLSFLIQFILMVAAFLMWWTIIAPLKNVGKFSYFVRVAYVFLNSLLLMPLGIFLILSLTNAHYSVYDAANYRFFSGMNGILDQQLAGTTLKFIQLLGYGTALFFLIVRWGKEEEKREDENIRVVQGIVIQLPEKKS